MWYFFTSLLNENSKFPEIRKVYSAYNTIEDIIKTYPIFGREKIETIRDGVLYKKHYRSNGYYIYISLTEEEIVKQFKKDKIEQL